jgi:REP element-mobilizing transposase RayT
MANTYTSLHYHIVFSTKSRERWIEAEVEQRVWAYLGGIAKQIMFTCCWARRLCWRRQRLRS